jgi:hypothetical protein
MGHVVGAGSGITLLQLAANAVALVGRRPSRSERLALLQALRYPATAEEAASERRTVELVVGIVRAQRAAATRSDA